MIDVVLAMLSRPPRGGRGLKPKQRRGVEGSPLSPPTRGAWIETFQVCTAYGKDRVAPHAGGVD